MDPEVRWAEIALTELHDAAVYIARVSPQAAQDLLRAARDGAASLGTFPQAAAMVQEFDDPTVREVFVKKRYLPYRQRHSLGDWLHSQRS